MSRQVAVAAAAWPVQRPAHFDDLAARYSDWCEAAARAGARLLVFPEYGLMELAGLEPDAVAKDLGQATEVVAAGRRTLEPHLSALAVAHEVTILGPSGPEQVPSGYVNRARLFLPDGRVHIQDKQIMTRYEREVWGLLPGAPQRPVDTPMGRLGVLICYDSEFPLLARALVENGAETLLIPACTDTTAGHARVRIAARARALENQCVTVHAPLVGRATWCPAIDENTGIAAVFGPPDTGFPETGILAEGRTDEPGWVHARFDAAQIVGVRRDGAVANHTDWDRQRAILRDKSP